MLSSIASFISTVGFPAFIAYYLLSKYTEERKRVATYEMILTNLESSLKKFNETINYMLAKLDRIIELNVSICERVRGEQ